MSESHINHQNNVREIFIENDLVWTFYHDDYVLKLSFKIIGNERQNQDLGEDENRVSNEDDTQRSNNSDENTRGIFITPFK
jgi:hypothetical protein